MGSAVGSGVGVGPGVGESVGATVGFDEGPGEGLAVGEGDGLTEGAREGFNDGNEVGFADGPEVGSPVGKYEGRRDGESDGDIVGFNVGIDDGWLVVSSSSRPPPWCCPIQDSWWGETGRLDIIFAQPPSCIELANININSTAEKCLVRTLLFISTPFPALTLVLVHTAIQTQKTPLKKKRHFHNADIKVLFYLAPDKICHCLNSGLVERASLFLRARQNVMANI